MATITAAMLRDLLGHMRERSGAPGTVLVAHPDHEVALRALPELIPSPFVPVWPENMRSIAALSPPRIIGKFDGHWVRLDPECPRESVYALPADEGE